MQRHSFFLHIHVRLGIDRQGDGERVKERWFDLAHEAEARPELGMDGRPAYQCGLGQGVQLLSQPNIHVDRDAPRAPEQGDPEASARNRRPAALGLARVPVGCRP